MEFDGPRRNTIRELLESLKHRESSVDGHLSLESGLFPPHPLAKLTGEHGAVWEYWVQRLPDLYQTGQYRAFFAQQPVLSCKELPDTDLLRANQILGLCAHAVVHFSEDVVTDTLSATSSPGGWITAKPDQCPFSHKETKASDEDPPTSKPNKSEDRIPPAILIPWKEANKRLGRPRPTFTYYDYFTLNVVPTHGDRQLSYHAQNSRLYTHSRCDVAVFGDRGENVFVLMNHDMEFQAIPLVRHCCEAVDAILDRDDAALTEILFAMGTIVKRITHAFERAIPNSYSDLFCDGVGWSKSVGLLIPPILDGEMSMSGLQSSATHLLDHIIGRYEFTGELGALANEERPWLPRLHQEFFTKLSEISIRKYVLSRLENRALTGSFNRLVRLFCHGFLEAHRIKICGFLELGIKTGRSESSGQTAQAASGWQQRVWRKVNADCLHSIHEREQLQTTPAAKGFTLAFVETIDEQTPGSESYRVVFSIADTGIRYRAGDRVEILPRNNVQIVKRMLLALGVDDGLEVTLPSKEWTEAVEQQYSGITGSNKFPLASLLKIMALRPLTKQALNDICDLMRVKDRSMAERNFQGGKLTDVPDLVEYLHGQQCLGSANIQEMAIKMFQVLPPLQPRLYSIANSPGKEGNPSTVSIVISRLWYHVNSLESSGKENRMGVCTSFLLNDSLYDYVPLRVVEEDKFHLPNATSDSPIMLVALGSGAAPMFAFLEELLCREGNCPEIFFCWGLAKSENLFGVPLLERAINEIGLKLCVSFSREQKTVKVNDGKITVVPGRRERVTTTMTKMEWPKIISRLAKGNGIFYLCGHPMMETLVRAVIEGALSTVGRLSLLESEEMYRSIVASQRIRADLFYSGSIHSSDLLTFSVAEVARHCEPDDMWWIFEGYVYDISDYSKLHPGGNKILFDKAGRDATKDFEVAHGPNNLRVKSGMLPYRKGKLALPNFKSFPQREAYNAIVELLHTICEIRNVFCLDLNMFEGGHEGSGNPHSLAMRFKTHEKFINSSLPMLETAVAEFSRKQDGFESAPLRLTELFVANLQSLRQRLSSLTVEKPGGLQLFVATDLCKLERAFLSKVLSFVIDFVQRYESGATNVPDDAVLKELCDETCQSITRRLTATASVFRLTEPQAETIYRALKPHEKCAPLCKIDLIHQEVVGLQLNKGDCVFSSGDIIDLIYVILEGDITTTDQNIEIDSVSAGSAVGALMGGCQVDATKHALGNEVMSATATVSSPSCRVVVLQPTQILVPSSHATKETRSPRKREAPKVFRDGQPSNNSLWKKAKFHAHMIGAVQSLLKETIMRKCSLLAFLSPFSCQSLANKSTEVAFQTDDVLAKARDVATKCWVLIEGKVGVTIESKGIEDGEDGTIWEYSRPGQMFGEKCFTRGQSSRVHQESYTALASTRCLEIPGHVLENYCKGPLVKEAYALGVLDSVITKHPFFARLQLSARHSLLHEFRQVKIRSNEVVYEEGEAGNSAFVVVSGCLVGTTNQSPTDGTSPTKVVLGESKSTGLGLLIEPGERSMTCRATETTICWTASHSSLVEGLGKDVVESLKNQTNGPDSLQHLFQTPATADSI